MKPINLVKHSIGNNFPEYIEINKNLIYDHRFRSFGQAIIRHEREHDKNNYFWQDLISELKMIKYFPVMLKFHWCYPKSLRQYFLFYFENGKLIYDLNKIILWIFICIGLIIIIKK